MAHQVEDVEGKEAEVHHLVHHQTWNPVDVQEVDAFPGAFLQVDQGAFLVEVQGACHEVDQEASLEVGQGACLEVDRGAYFEEVQEAYLEVDQGAFLEVVRGVGLVEEWVRRVEASVDLQGCCFHPKFPAQTYR